ncbi:MAG: chemotaxis protein CheW [Deltaproteobacteria bacterium]|nr:chemotaxis protein CheW [Deltaproteobacteria bacterium]MBW2393658.1 chemotaxis protein CheW [Deltaproteobacteria bacterium]
MSEPVSASLGELGDRLLAFELCGALYAVPITDVAEVTELHQLASVPMVHHQVGGVVNYHGDAVPIVFGDALLQTERPHYLSGRPLLILARDPDDPNRYGVPVDKIVGLIDGPAAHALDADPVAERRPHAGRMVSVLDPKRLLERAMEVISRSVANGAAEPTHEESI